MLSCEKDNGTNTIQTSLLQKTWLHSYEEGDNIYRPNDYTDFPPSRYRQYFAFQKNNICSYSVLAPNDAHYDEKGEWKFNPNDNILEIKNSKAEVLYRFKILELKTDILKVESIRLEVKLEED
ncbi:MAG: hypothetical protein CSB01_03115 [Bacteroidia bacterium]|nr:MAG: hypothetical protein CSB01_03115 [Bacteroidia bacterium]